MTIPAAIIVAFVVSTCAWLTWSLARVVRVWRRFNGERVVTCPETGYPAAVSIDLPHAAMTAVVRGGEEVRLAECSRWATRGPCDQECVFEARDCESAVREIVSRWYAARVCVYCGKPIDDEHFLLDHDAALLAPDGMTREWSDVPPEMLPDALRTHRPVCWNCHVAETFRRKHPELVTDRTPIPDRQVRS